MFGFLFTKIARKAVDMVLGQLTQQINVLDDIVRAPMQAMIGEVTGGAWVGQGADAFVNELTNMFIPGTDGLKAGVSGISAGIGNALDLLDEADSKAQGIVGDIVDIFDSIF